MNINEITAILQMGAAPRRARFIAATADLSAQVQPTTYRDEIVKPCYRRWPRSIDTPSASFAEGPTVHCRAILLTCIIGSSHEGLDLTWIKIRDAAWTQAVQFWGWATIELICYGAANGW